jgi:two-component system sensor histidine kinase KdpD
MFERGTKDLGEKGYGLGLSICRAIVEAHGGGMWGANRPGGGAVVRFTFPLKIHDFQ